MTTTHNSHLSFFILFLFKRDLLTDLLLMAIKVCCKVSSYHSLSSGQEKVRGMTVLVELCWFFEPRGGASRDNLQYVRYVRSDISNRNKELYSPF